MKSIPTSLFFKEQPLPKGMDVALIFAIENQKAINEHYARLQKGFNSLKEEEEALAGKNYWIGPLIVAVAGIILGVAVNLYFFILTVAGGIWFAVSYFDHNKKLDLIKEKRQKLIKERDSTMPQMIKKIGTVNYCAEILPFADGTVVTDESGILDNSEIRCSLVDNCEDRLRELMNKKSQLNSVFPVLLPPGESKGNNDEIYLTGVEKDVEELLNMLDSMINDCSEISIELPVYKKDDRIPKIIKDCDARFAASSNNLVSVRKDGDRSAVFEKLKLTNSEAEAVKSYGFKSIDQLMSQVFLEIDEFAGNLTDNRNYSINEVLLNSIGEIENIYDFPLTRFYNPRLSGSLRMENPIRKYEGIDFENIEEARFESFYKKNDMLKLKDIQSQVKNMIKSLPENDKAINNELNAYLQKRYEKYAELIKEMSVEISPEEEEENSKHFRNAFLLYNKFRKKWICQLTNEEFNDEQALRSRILKIREDLINPVWDKLWLEKHDEKVRIIREKEQELRGNKKQENSEMREEVKIFTEELRPIRNNLEKSAVEVKVGEQKLKLSINFYTSQGILDNKTVERMKSYLSTEETSVDTVFQTADTMEANLEKEPESAMLLRGDLKDYTLEVRNKEKFYIAEK